MPLVVGAAPHVGVGCARVGGLPARIWRDFMMDAHRGLPPRPLPGLDIAPPSPSAPMLVAEEDAPPPGPTGPLSDVPLIGQFQKLIQSLTGSGTVKPNWFP